MVGSYRRSLILSLGVLASTSSCVAEDAGDDAGAPTESAGAEESGTEGAGQSDGSSDGGTASGTAGEAVCPQVAAKYVYGLRAHQPLDCSHAFEGNTCWVFQTGCSLRFDCNGNGDERFGAGPLSEDGVYESSSAWSGSPLDCRLRFDDEEVSFTFRCTLAEEVCRGVGFG